MAEGKEPVDNERPTILVHIENHAAVPPETIARCAGRAGAHF
jgi:hypothetical protein